MITIHIKRTATVFMLLTLIVGFNHISCDFDNPVDDFNLILNVEVEKPIYSGDISANPTEIQLVPDGTTINPGARGGYLGKTTATDFIEVPINIPNMNTFLSILEDETASGGNFVGTLINRATNPVTFGVYFSSTAGLADPWGAPEATFVASVTLSPAPSPTVPADPVLIDGPEDFDNPTNPEDVKANLLTFVQAAVAIDPSAPIYVYLTSLTPQIDPAEEIDVIIEEMSLFLPAEVEIWNTVTPGDLDNYANKIEEIINAEMTGSITNTGTANLIFYAYLHLETEDFNPSAHRIARVSIDPGNTLIFEDYPDMFVPGDPTATPPRLSGEQKLRNGVSALQSSNNLTIYLHFYSTDHVTPISATITSIELESNVQIIE